MSEIKRLSDLKPAAPKGERVDLAELVDQEIVVRYVEFRQGSFGEYAVVYFENEKFSDAFFTTGGQAIMKTLKAYYSHLPFVARVVRRRSANRRYYYDLQ